MDAAGDASRLTIKKCQRTWLAGDGQIFRLLAQHYQQVSLSWERRLRLLSVLLNTAHNCTLPNAPARKCQLPSITARNSRELPRVSGKYTCPGQFSWELQKGGQVHTLSFAQWTNHV